MSAFFTNRFRRGGGTITLRGRGAHVVGVHVSLPVDALLTIGPRGCAEITCENGAIWITQEGDQRDHVLFAGDRFLPQCGGSVVLWAINDAMVLLQKMNIGRE